LLFLRYVLTLPRPAWAVILLFMVPPVAVMTCVCYSAQLFCWVRDLWIFLGWSGTVTLLISASHISRHSHSQLLVEMESLNLCVHVNLKQWSSWS
jgi:hypothetical protein